MNNNSRTLRRKFFQKKIPIYRKNPVLFAQEVLLFEPDDWQKQALMDLAESPKVAIKSGQGVGKTGMEAVALLWFLCCYPYPRIVATAPTKQQLHLCTRRIRKSSVWKFRFRSTSTHCRSRNSRQRFLAKQELLDLSFIIRYQCFLHTEFKEEMTL